MAKSLRFDVGETVKDKRDGRAHVIEEIIGDIVFFYMTGIDTVENVNAHYELFGVDLSPIPRFSLR